jgi:uncharacterized protein VirK/YbjX
MTDWNPGDVLGTLGYLKFKLRLWVEVPTVPEWVRDAEQSYYTGFVEKYGHRPYDQEKEFVSDNLKYKVRFIAVAQGRIEAEYYAKIKG